MCVGTRHFYVFWYEIGQDIYTSFDHLCQIITRGFCYPYIPFNYPTQLLNAIEGSECHSIVDVIVDELSLWQICRQDIGEHRFLTKSSTVSLNMPGF